MPNNINLNENSIGDTDEDYKHQVAFLNQDTSRMMEQEHISQSKTQFMARNADLITPLPTSPML